jgi:membrane-associated phospholipid phosphatase
VAAKGGPSGTSDAVRRVYTRRHVRGRAPRSSARALRRLAWGAVAAGTALPPFRRRLRVPRPLTAAVVTVAPFGMAIAAPRSRRRDVAVYALQMWAFIVIHELPYDEPEALEGRVRVDYPIACDRLLGLGELPTLRLQRVLRRPGRPTALDHVLVWVHWLWFLEPHATAAWILWRHPARFPRAAALISALFHLGAIVYFTVPTAPPWWAADQDRLQDGGRIMVDVGKEVWGDFWLPLYDFLGGNPVAAMPSLHFSSAVMAAHVLSELGSKEGTIGWAYAGTLGFALVYLGEHYLIDLIAGLALAETVRLLAPAAAPPLLQASRAVAALEKRARSG